MDARLGDLEWKLNQNRILIVQSKLERILREASSLKVSIVWVFFFVSELQIVTPERTLKYERMRTR